MPLPITETATDVLASAAELLSLDSSLPARKLPLALGEGLDTILRAVDQLGPPTVSRNDLAALRDALYQHGGR